VSDRPKPFSLTRFYKRIGNVVLHCSKKRNTVMHRYVSVLLFLLSVMPLGCRKLHFSFFRLLAELTGNFHRELGVYSSGGSLEPV
jgi:hypothetical protein